MVLEVSSVFEVVAFKVGWVVVVVFVPGRLKVGAGCIDEEVLWAAVLALGRLKVGAEVADDAAVLGVSKRLGVGAFVVLLKRLSDGTNVAGVPVVFVPEPDMGGKGVAFAVERLPNTDGFAAADAGVASLIVLGCEVGRLKSDLGAAAVAEFVPGVVEVEVEPGLS